MHKALLWGAGAIAKASQQRVFCAATTATCYVLYQFLALHFPPLTALNQYEPAYEFSQMIAKIQTALAHSGTLLSPPNNSISSIEPTAVNAIDPSKIRAGFRNL